MKKKFVYEFEEGSKDMRTLLGGKGANLAEMTNIGMSVPPGFTITTEACLAFYDNDKNLPDGLMEEIVKNIKKVEEIKSYLAIPDMKHP